MSLIADTPHWIISRKTLPANDLKELIAWLKANNGKASAARSASAGRPISPALFFQKQTGTHFQFVPYRGGAPLLQDLLGGPDRLHLRPGGDLSRPSAQRPAQGLRGAVQSAGGRRRTCRPSTRPACRASMPRSGTASGRRRARRRRSSPSSTPPCRDAGRSDGAAALQGHRPGDLARATSRRRRRSPRKQKAEIERWWPIIKATSIKARMNGQLAGRTR